MKKQIGIERAFPPRQIVETKQTALGCRAITQVRALTVAGQLYVNYAHNIQWNESTGTAEIYVGREWIPLTRIGIESWASEEGLNILNADGTVTLCVDALPDEQDTPIIPMQPVGGGGGGGFDEVLDEDEAVIIQAAMEYLSAMPTATMDDMSIHTLLTVGAFLMSPHNQSLQRAAVDAADRFFCSFVPIQTGGGGSVSEELAGYIQLKTLRQAGISYTGDMQSADQELEDHLNDGWLIVNLSYPDGTNTRYVMLQREMTGGGGDPEGLMKHVTPGLFKRGDRVYQVLVNPETGDEKNYYGTVDEDEIEYRDMVLVKFDDSPAFARTVAPWFLWLVEEDGAA